MLPQHDNDTNCTDSTLLKDHLAHAAVGKTTIVDSEASSLLANTLNLFSSVSALRCLGFPPSTYLAELIEDLESTTNNNNDPDNIGRIKGDADVSQLQRAESSHDCKPSEFNQNDEVIYAGSLPEKYEDDVKSRFEPIRQDFTAESEDQQSYSLNNCAAWTEEDGSWKRCWLLDSSSPGEVASFGEVPSSTSSPVTLTLDLSLTRSSSIPLPYISQDLSYHSNVLDLSATSISYDLINSSEHEIGTRTAFDVRNEYKGETGEISENGSWSAFLDSDSTVPFNRESRTIKKPAENAPVTPSPAFFSRYPMPSIRTGRVMWFCNYGCHKPVSWKDRPSDTEHRRQETERQTEEDQEEKNGKMTVFPMNPFFHSWKTNELAASEVVASLPLLSSKTGDIYSKDPLFSDVLATCLPSSLGEDMNCNCDPCTRSDVKSAEDLLSNSQTPYSAHAPVCPRSTKVSRLAETVGQYHAQISRNSVGVATSEGIRGCLLKEARSIDKISANLQAKVMKLQEQRCCLVAVFRRYHEERQVQQRQVMRLRMTYGTAKKKELMVHILRELRLMLASQVVSLQRSYDQILSKQWRGIFHGCILCS